MYYPEYETVTGQVQNPSLIMPVNVIVTIPVVGSCEHDPDGVPVTLFKDHSGYIVAWSIVHLIGSVANVQANKMEKEPVEYPQLKSHGLVRASDPVITVVGQPVLQLMLGGIGVDGPAVNDKLEGNVRKPQHG